MIEESLYGGRLLVIVRLTRPHIFWFILLLLNLGLPSPFLASPPSGERIRLHRSEDKIIGQLVSWDSNKVVVQTTAGIVKLSQTEITAAERSAGKKGHMLQGMLIGAGIGVVSVLVADETHENSDIGVDLLPYQIAGAGLVFGLVGGLIGYLVKTERWYPIDVTDRYLRTRLMPQGGLGVEVIWSRLF